MPHYDYGEFPLGEATVRVALAPVGEPAGGAGGADLPGGIGGVTPVGSGDRIAALASDALRAVLSPLGPVLQQVHDAVLATPDPPQELAVTFGVQIGQDLKLGVVGAGGQASMTVTASWQFPVRD
ncbi:CU044_2847 family protein [Streptomyces rimosus]|uniref:CU044_2847 family protein n=1 Tax=Streptomyces rimosus TaxID=1927 RepID=UPI0004CC6D25|nr:CU044_2847 family protein [Streptomyces rimosus]